MKILVDEMPELTCECLFCLDKSTMDSTEFICTWRTPHHRCLGVGSCPYFKEATKYDIKLLDEEE